MNLTEFLMRVYDDEEAAYGADDELLAKRAIVTECTDAIAEGAAESTVWLAQRVLLLLAQPYKDHPDFAAAGGAL